MGPNQRATVKQQWWVGMNWVESRTSGDRAGEWARGEGPGRSAPREGDSRALEEHFPGAIMRKWGSRVEERWRRGEFGDVR